MAERFALFAVASLNGVVIDEVRVGQGKPLRIGRSGDLIVPVPAGADFVAKGRWVDGREVEIEDGRGELHRLGPDGTLQIGLGPLQLELRLTQLHELRRTEPIVWHGSLAFFAVLFAFTLMGSQADVVARNMCPWFGLNCPVVQQVSGVSEGLVAEYLARLLRKDLDGEDDGVIVQRTPVMERKGNGFMPAGDLGPITEFGGADETAPEPVRVPPPEELTPAPAARDHESPLEAPENIGTPIVQPEDETPLDGQADRDLGLDTDVTEDVEVEPDELPAEEERGWGLREWMDASAAEREEHEIDEMIDLAKDRLRIDPEDLIALGVLSQYQYLQSDFDGAERTYDKMLELSPEDPATYNNQALVHKRRGDYQKEEGLYRVALALDPSDFTVMNNLAVNLAHQGRFDEAFAYMERVEQLDPGDPYSDLHRAKIYAQMGDGDRAMGFLRTALEGMMLLDTLHHIEFRQDIRVDPSFEQLRGEPRFRAILYEFYGEDTPLKE